MSLSVANTLIYYVMYSEARIEMLSGSSLPMKFSGVTDV